MASKHIYVVHYYSEYDDRCHFIGTPRIPRIKVNQTLCGINIDVINRYSGRWSQVNCKNCLRRQEADKRKGE